MPLRTKDVMPKEQNQLSFTLKTNNWISGYCSTCILLNTPQLNDIDVF